MLRNPVICETNESCLLFGNSLLPGFALVILEKAGNTFVNGKVVSTPFQVDSEIWGLMCLGGPIHLCLSPWCSLLISTSN